MNKSTRKQLDYWRALVDGALIKYLSGNSFPEFARPVSDAMRYSVFSGGKRIRPILAIASADACGMKVSQVLPVACAIELIHTYSLIHDDLPCMDDSDYRRGKPSAHKKFSEGLAVLSGDALLTKAFELIALSRVSGQRALRVIKIVAEAAGPQGMIGGQVANTFQNYGKLSRNRQKALIKYIHSHKTGDLISASVMAGAALAGARGGKLSALEKYGRLIGFVFQIVDDIFDNDKNRLTYPGLHGMEYSKKTAAGMIDSAKNHLKIFGDRAAILSELADYVVQRKN